jgi:hypothetical protein
MRVVPELPSLGESMSGNQIGLDAYPNPTSDQLTIRFDTSERGDQSLMLLDLSGRVLRSEVVNAESGINTLTWNLEGYQSGIYILALRGSEGLSQLRIVLEK